MPVALNHTIIAARDRDESAAFFASLFGLPAATVWGPFAIVPLAGDGFIQFAAPNVPEIQMLPGQINTNHGGRGVYFLDPAGHGLEIITRPYGNTDEGAADEETRQ